MQILKSDLAFKVGVKKRKKYFKSDNYNYAFDLDTGFFARWGATQEEDPGKSPYGPEIADIEITTICDGINGKLCAYCYKSNTNVGDNMSLDTFKKVIDQVNFNQQLTQVAFGLGASGKENPDLWDMCTFLRENHIVPNGTVAQLDDETAEKIANNFGGVAVSAHLGKGLIDTPYGKVDAGFEVLADTIEKLVKYSKSKSATLRQVNIHFMIAEETYDDCLELFRLVKEDPRYAGLNAVVLLGLKQCGRAKKGFNILSEKKFKHLVELSFEKDIGLGFDSCSALKFQRAAEKLNKEGSISDEKLEQLIQLIEPCESGLFSAYVNTHGKFYPCSFNEVAALEYDLLKEDASFKKLWSTGLDNWRGMLEKSGRACPTYKI